MTEFEEDARSLPLPNDPHLRRHAGNWKNYTDPGSANTTMTRNLTFR
jgi:hypothetical protein